MTLDGEWPKSHRMPPTELGAPHLDFGTWDSRREIPCLKYSDMGHPVGSFSFVETCAVRT
jgi:hypothetical protein